MYKKTEGTLLLLLMTMLPFKPAIFLQALKAKKTSLTLLNGSGSPVLSPMSSGRSTGKRGSASPKRPFTHVPASPPLTSLRSPAAATSHHQPTDSVSIVTHHQATESISNVNLLMPLAYRSSVNNVESSPTVSTFSMTPDQVPTPYRQSPPALPLSSSQQLDELSMIDLNLARGTTGSATSQTALTSHN